MSFPILLTKLNIPPVRSQQVRRPQLVARLNEGSRVKLLLISAPAGYGKTTLAVDWLRQLPADCSFAWYSLDEGDNDPRRFLSYFITALQQIYTDFGRDVAALLQSYQPEMSEAIWTLLLNEIALFPGNIILVLDDYHAISSLQIHEQLAFVLEHQSTNMHLVILTREDPLLPIPRLRVQGQILEIRQDKLRFTIDETDNFLSNVMGLPLSSDDIAALEHRTEGWIAGLHLAALSLQGRDDLKGFVQAFTGSSRFILDYLIEEVFERQPPDVKDFLLKTSILERLCGSLCDAVMGIATSQNVLETLEQANLFIVPLDQSRQWFRYHLLFAELLRHRLRLSKVNEGELHQRASLWFEQNGTMYESVQHALLAKDWDRSAALLHEVTTELLKRGEVATLIGWYRVFPFELLPANPKLCFDYCWSFLLAGEFDTVAPLLDQLEKNMAEMPEYLGEVYAAQAYLAGGLGNHERMVEKSQQALTLLPRQSVSSRSVVALNLGLAYWHMGKMRLAEEVLAEALNAGQVTGNLYLAITAVIFLGRVFAVRGQLHRAKEYFERAIQQGGEIPINALANLDLSTLYCEWNDLDASENYLQKAILLSQRAHNEEFLATCWLQQSHLRLALDDFAGADEAIDKAREMVRKGKISSAMMSRVDVAQVHCLLAKGEATQEWEQKLSEKVDSHSFYRFLGVTKARVLTESHARAYLEGLSKVARENEWVYGLITCRVLQSLLAETQEQALEFLAAALQDGEEGGFIRTFADAGKSLIPLLQETWRRGFTPNYVKRILTVMVKKEGGADIDRLPLLVELSNREIEVLTLVRAGLSNREIARQLYISPGTAKTHIHNLCRKLGVRNRTEAAMKANELGLD